MEELGLERPLVAGNSLGGGIALELGRRGWAGAVCAISPIGFAAGREGAYARATLKSIHAIARRLDGVAGKAYGGPARRAALMSLSWPGRRTSPRGRGALEPRDRPLPRLERDAPGRDELASGDARVPDDDRLGEHDRLLLAGRQAPRARRRLPEARHVTLHGCGHVPTWDDPEQVARAILDAAR